MLLALSCRSEAAAAERWAGSVLSVNLPSSLACGASYEAWVTLRNEGTTTWTRREGYALWTLDTHPDGTLFPGSRASLAPDTAVTSRSAHRFSFVLRAPRTRGEHRLTLSLARDLAWFGPVLERTVAVQCEPKAVTLCPGVDADPTGRSPAARALQRCLDGTAGGGVLALPEGLYRMDRQVVVRRPVTVRTAGASDRVLACGPGIACAVLQAAPDLDARFGFLLVSGTHDVMLDHLVLDGNREARLRGKAARRCAGAENRWGYNATVQGCRSCAFTRGVSKNALCGTALEWRGDGARIVGNTFEDNGQDSVPRMWADGLTIHASDGALVAENRFLDSTDVALVCGGARYATFRDNVIEQSRRTAFAGIMLDNFNGTTSGDFTGAVVAGNRIDCGAEARRCHFGINLGPHAWYLSRNIVGGTVTRNVVRNARQGINVDGAGTAESPIELFGNDVAGSPESAQFCEVRKTSSININVADSFVERRDDDAEFTTSEWHRCE